MIGYKATNMDGCCRGFKFEVGKTYTKDTPKDKLTCCTDSGFHFCRELSAIEKESNYKLSESRLFEVIAGDFVRDGDKYCTNSITILREIVGKEKEELINSGNCNSGDRNSGDWNSGNCNSGDWNSGDWNSGNCNSGDWNSGNCNSGNWNSGDWNSGFFNTNEPCARFFNKNTKKRRCDFHFPSWLFFDLNVWVSHDTATEKEKAEHKTEIETHGGFLKAIEYKQAWRIAWNKAGKEEHKELLKLPNWNNKIFKEITGIDAEAEIAKEQE